jgi:hypothetical protein
LKGLQTDTEYEIAYARTPTSNNARISNTRAQDIQGHGKRKGLNASTSDEDDIGSTEREEIDNSALKLESQSKSKKRKRATPQKLDKQEQDEQDKNIAEGLSEKILDQLDRIYQREISAYPQEIEALVDRYQRADENEQISILMALRERMWEGGECCEDNEALAPDVLRWTRKFCSSCILYMLRKKRAIQATDTQRNWADATSIIHSVVKGLLDEEGTKVLGLFAALAGKGLRLPLHCPRTEPCNTELNHGLTEASKKSKGRQVNIGNLLTDELRGRLRSLPRDYLVPFPPVYLSWVTGKP